METRGTTGEETISYWFELPIDVAEFEEKLGVGTESGDYRIIEKVLPGLMSIFWTQKVKLFYAALLANNSH